jgi:hypothetical protein
MITSDGKAIPARGKGEVDMNMKNVQRREDHEALER